MPSFFFLVAHFSKALRRPARSRDRTARPPEPCKPHQSWRDEGPRVRKVGSVVDLRSCLAAGTRPVPSPGPPSGLQSRRPSRTVQTAPILEGRGPPSPKSGQRWRSPFMLGSRQQACPQPRTSKRPPEPSALQNRANRTNLGGTRAPESVKWVALAISVHAWQQATGPFPAPDLQAASRAVGPPEPCKPHQSWRDEGPRVRKVGSVGDLRSRLAAGNRPVPSSGPPSGLQSRRPSSWYLQKVNADLG